MKFLSVIVLCIIVSISHAYEFQWEIDETPQGQESATIVQPVNVVILDQHVEIADNSASIRLMQKYGIHLGQEWNIEYASKLLQTFDSIPQRTHFRTAGLPQSIFILTDQHIHNDIDIQWHGESRIVTISTHAFEYTTPKLAEIDGIRGKYFSKRLHHAIVRFVTDNGNDKGRIRYIFNRRYGIDIYGIDYTELTQHTTGEHAGRFTDFKDHELISLISMLEEYPTGMIKTPGLKYIIRRLDGTPNPKYPNAPAVAWVGAGYIEFMDTAFQIDNIDHTYRLILHEKAHFLWEYLFDDQLKQDWIELGGWYENPDDQDGWSTTKQTEFVSDYAHGINPNEDMAESISYYIVRPDKLRSRSPAKYEFIQNRIMHGTRYISQIREDLTFVVYNLYPDYVYPGKIKKIYIQVEGEPEQDKIVNIEITVHRESELDSVSSAHIRVYSQKGTSFDFAWLTPGTKVGNSQILHGHYALSKYAAHGYWTPDTIKLYDPHGNARLESQSDFGWKLYINNPLADDQPPQYVPNSMRLTLHDAITEHNEPYQIITATWDVIEHTQLSIIRAYINDTYSQTYSRHADKRKNNWKATTVSVDIAMPHYMPKGNYQLNRISMKDMAGNQQNVYFTDSPSDENPQVIHILTNTPDLQPPTLDINTITINAHPTNPTKPNGETNVLITFYAKDDISGYKIGSLYLADPQGVLHHYFHYPNNTGRLYFDGDPTQLKMYEQNILLPVGSPPGTWGLANFTLRDNAGNKNHYDFTELVRFEVDQESSENKYDLNNDGKINILDLVLVANAFGTYNPKADVNNDNVINILDLVIIANQM